MALLWDDIYLYAGYRVEDPDIRAVMTGLNEHVYLSDECVELFVDLGAGYFEVGVNALNNSYQVNWTWLEHVVESADWTRLDALLRCHDGLYFVPRPGDVFGRLGDLAYRCPGLLHATHVQGSLNAPGLRDDGWSVMLKIPWSSLRAIGVGSAFRPEVGAQIRLNGYRAHQAAVTGGTAEGWAWAPTGNANVHVPESWILATLVGARTP